MPTAEKKEPWYVGGLHFECQQCGACCSGPGQGYIWVTRAEIEFIADYLKISQGRLRREYLKRVGFRTTIIEHSDSRDCIFLKEIDGRKRCLIYPVRPSQCRTWPFWSENLRSPNAWNKAAQKCGGINRGRFYSFEQIQKIRANQRWWEDEKQQSACKKSG